MPATLYVSDLDGTLLRNDATLSEFSRNTLSELLRQGVPFSVASARSVVSIGMMLRGLKLELPIIEFNGAFISELDTGRHLITNGIAREVVESIYPLIGQFGCVPFISSFNGTDDCLYHCDIINEGMQWYLDSRTKLSDKRLRPVADFSGCFQDDVVCLTVIARAEVLRELRQAVEELHAESVEMQFMENQYSPGWYWLTIHDYRASKDQALRRVRDDFGLHEHELVAFGDQNNDIKMFQAADRAYAVSNATDDLKRHATAVIGANEEDSVAHFIQSDWSARAGHSRSSAVAMR